MKQLKHIANYLNPIIYLFYNTLILLSESKNMAIGVSKRTLATLIIYRLHMQLIGLIAIEVAAFQKIATARI